MTIADIITRYYDILHKELDCELVISQGRTSEDILQDICITALRKYKDNQITEEEGLAYLKKTLYTERHFSWNRKKGEMIVFTNELPDIPNI